MGLSLNPQHLKRYADIARLLWRHGRSDAFRQLSAFGELPDEEEKAGRQRARPEDLAGDLEAMGPTFVKLGQILSSRPDLMPEPYLQSLARLQDNVKQFQITVRPSEMFMKTVQKVANRITAGLVLAALIVGAALLMQVPTNFEVFGYPGLAIICFLAAAAGGVALLCNIFFSDHKDRKTRHTPHAR